jgi:Tfp pilus assembly protein PilO
LAQTEYNLIQDDIFLIDEALPTDAQVSTLTKQLEVLAHRSGVTAETFKFGQVSLKGEGPKTEEKTKSEASSVNFSFAAVGEYQNLKSFLQSLSLLRRIILVESFAFKTGKTEGESLTLSLNAQTFFLKED